MKRQTGLVLVLAGTIGAIAIFSPSRPAPIVTPSPMPAARPDQPPLSALAAYEVAADPIDRKIGNANAIASCGIRDMDWYDAVVRNLEDYRGPLLRALVPADQWQAQGFDLRTTRDQQHFTLSNGTASCGQLATMPFVHNDAAFLP